MTEINAALTLVPVCVSRNYSAQVKARQFQSLTSTDTSSSPDHLLFDSYSRNLVDYFRFGRTLMFCFSSFFFLWALFWGHKLLSRSVVMKGPTNRELALVLNVSSVLCPSITKENDTPGKRCLSRFRALGTNVGSARS